MWLVHKFEWLFYLFGAWLIWTGWALLRAGDDDDKDVGFAIRLAQRILPVDVEDSTGRFAFRRDGKWVFTRLAVALMAIEVADVVFAVDSVPAVLGVTTDAFIVLTSNIYAILGLRSLFFVLGAMLVKFRYLGTALALILIFVGGKMLLHDVFEIPVVASLLVVVLGLLIGIGASVASERMNPAPD